MRLAQRCIVSKYGSVPKEEHGLLVSGVCYIGWAICLWTFGVTGASRNTHGKATKANYARVLVVGSKKWNGIVAGAVDRVGVIDPNDGAILNFDGTVKA